MPLPSSGQISLNDIHVEAGGTSLSEAGINDADIRGLLSPTPASESEMAFSDWYGASSAASFKGSILAANGISIANISFANVNTIAAVGDLCIIAVASDGTLDTPQITVTGMTATILNATNSSVPGWLFAYGFRQSGDSNTIGFSASGQDGQGISSVFSVFGGVSSLTNYSFLQSSGVPDPPNLVSASPTKLIVTTAHLDDDYILMTAPSGYTLAGANRETEGGRNYSAVAVAYKITNTSQAENPGQFGGGGNDAYAVYTLRFA